MRVAVLLFAVICCTPANAHCPHFSYLLSVFLLSCPSHLFGLLPPPPPPYTHSFAAAHCPFVLVPNANHGQSSNGIPNYARGDIKAQLSDEEARASFAAAIGEFATAHEGGSPAARAAATSALLQRCRATAELMAPYFLASGACCV
jgi:hypothetical protein